MALVLADYLDFSSLLVAHRNAQNGELGSRGVLCMSKGFGIPTGYARFGRGCTRLAAETLACYYWLESLCKGIVVHPCNDILEV